MPKAPLFGVSQALHQPERLVGPMTAVLLLVGSIPIMLFTPDAARSGVGVLKAFAEGARSLWRMLTTVGRHRDAAIFLVGALLLRGRHDRGAHLLRHLRDRA